MTQLPKPRYFILLWIILLAYLTFDFIKDAKKDFLQFNYDWDRIEVLDMVGEVDVDSLSHDYLELKKTFTISRSFNTNNSYYIEGNQKNYFRASEIIQKDSSIVFSGVKWINRIPNKDLKTGILKIIQLPVIQPDGKTITTLGDSQIIWREARGLRKELSLKCNLLFVGRKSDVFGYPYEGGTFDTANDLLLKIPNIEPTEYYILFFGAQDKGMENTKLTTNIQQIFNLLSNKKEVNEVLVITLPPSTNQKFNTYNQKFNELLIASAKGNAKIKIVDLNKYLEDKLDYLADDTVHLNEKGYSILNKLLRKEFNK